MLKASFQATFGKAHNPEYQFFKEYNCVDGTALIIGFNEGQPITSLRIFNQSLRIILFEKDVFLEEKIKKAHWVLGQAFEYHITALSEIQDAQTLFVPKEKGKMVKGKATFVEEDVADLLDKANALKRSPKKEENDTSEYEDGDSSVLRTSDTGTNPFVKQIGFVRQPLDNFKLGAELVIVEDPEVDPSFLLGAARTLRRGKATVVIPNLIPLSLEAGSILSHWSYRPYMYDPKGHTLEPFSDEPNPRSIFFIHESVFIGEEKVKLRP